MNSGRLWMVLGAVVVAGLAGVLFLKRPSSKPESVPAASPAARAVQPPTVSTAKIETPGLFPAGHRIVYFSNIFGRAGEAIVQTELPAGSSTQSALWILKQQPGAPVKEIFSGANAKDVATPVLFASDTALLYQFSAGDCSASQQPGCGIYKLTLATGETQQLLNDRTAGLAWAPNLSLLAYWDRPPGVLPVLTVFDYYKKRAVRMWLGQSDLDCAPKNLAFSLDGQSLYAQTCERGAFPLKEFSQRTGEVKQISPDVIGPVSAADGVYFIERGKAGGTQESSTLWRIATSGAEPIKVTSPFPYQTLASSTSTPLLIAYGDESGLILFDARTQSGFAAGKDCTHAAILGDKLQYAAGNKIVSDRKDCGAPPRSEIWGPGIVSRLTQLKTLQRRVAGAATPHEKAASWFELNQSADEIAKFIDGSGPLLAPLFNRLAETASGAGVEIRYCEIGESWAALSTGYEKYVELWPDGPQADEAWWKSHMESWCGDFEGSAEEYKAAVDLYSDFLKRFPNSSHAAEARNRLKENQSGLEQALKEEKPAATPKKQP